MAGPVSAFAARKAVQKPASKLARPVAKDQLGPGNSIEEVDVQIRPRKRRKTKQDPQIAHEDSQQIGHQQGFKHASQDVILLESGPSNDDSEGQDEKSGSEIEVQSPAPVQRLSTFVPTKKNVLSDTDAEWTVRLKPSDTLAILGQYDIWVKSGAISISGAVIHASSRLHRVYAPSTHSIPPIRPVFDPYGTGNSPCDVSIISCRSRLRKLKEVAPRFEGIWNGRRGSNDKRRSFINLQSSADDPHRRPLRLVEPPSDWQRLTAKFVSSNMDQQPLAIMVCGPKGAGKSTFCRMLANALLLQVPKAHQSSIKPQGDGIVAFLDLDPGQPEFSPPGELSLHKLKAYNLGPPYTHPTVYGDNITVRAHHFGYLSPKDNPHHYFQCAENLYNHYRRMGKCPLIVNCSGWVQGNGLDLLTDLVNGLELTDIVYMSTTGPEEVVSVLEGAASPRNLPLHQLTSQVSDYPTRTAADLRMMSTLSYFHVDSIEEGSIRWNASPLTSKAPLVVRYAEPNQDILAVVVLGDEQNPECYESVLEGCVVGIVVVERHFVAPAEGNIEPEVDMMDIEIADVPTPMPPVQGFERNGDDDQEIGPILRTSSGIPYIGAVEHIVDALPPSRSYSLGQAIIQGIDTTNKTFNLLTPIPSEILQAASQQNPQIVLVGGRLGPPTWAYTEQLVLEKERRSKREGGDKEVFGANEVRQWTEGQPWASVIERGRTGSAKVRRIRRDIRYKSQANGDASSGQ